MWIRSQDKSFLIDAKTIYLNVLDGTIMCYGYTKCLGVYNTYEKQLKVLDDLQCRIARSESGVYQMPEDE